MAVSIKNSLKHAVKLISSNPILLLPFFFYLFCDSLVAEGLRLALSNVAPSDPVMLEAYISSNLLQVLPIIGTGYLLRFIIFIFCEAVTFGMCKEVWEKGGTQLNTALEYGFSNFFRLILATVLIGLAFILVGLLYLPIVLIVGSGLISIFLLVLVYATFAVKFWWILPGLVIADRPFVESIKRDLKFADKNFFATLGLLLVLGVISIVFGILIGVVTLGFGSGGLMATIGKAISTVLLVVNMTFNITSTSVIYLTAIHRPEASSKLKK